MSIVRRNLMTEKNYTPYCGNGGGCHMPRTYFKDDQFNCPACGWVSQFPEDFIQEYKIKWNLGVRGDQS